MTRSPQEYLKQWFIKEKRIFPWRENPTPYVVWISEIMLQQTRAAVVVEYFIRWMKKFPTILSIAEAPLEELIKAWEGLGYYSRVRNIKKGALFLIENSKEIPSSLEELEQIPGIGPYTAGAIASFAFHQKAAAVDGNVTRVISRYYGLEGIIKREELEQKTLEFLSDHTPWIEMEALIELGATVCQKSANCCFCPLRQSCLAYKEGKVDLIPMRKKRTPSLYLHRQVAIILWENEVLIEKREEGKVLGGLMEFPSFSYIADIPLEERILQTFSLFVEWIEDFPLEKQTFTRYQVDLSPSVFRALSKKEDLRWEKKEKLMLYSFSSGHKRILQQLLVT